ncbi:MAG: selenocysteine-specific translation elongation factor [Chloroflexota bacterium]
MTGTSDQPRETFVIATAGHVDHGKSTLVRALTGIDPDRLAEEKARQMTIDLGFAHLDLPSGRRVGIIDVPGHERFIKNMLAGVGGIDAALLVIAADEGPMPQTREHLAILDLLSVSNGVIAITKRDLVDDEWLALVMEEAREAVSGTTLEQAIIVPVSAVTGEGLPELVKVLDTLLHSSRNASDLAKARLPIDRVFTVSGFGTVVTGTLLGGSLAVGQEVEVLPRGRVTRVRGLQSHGQKLERALPGSRVAVNIAGIAVEDVRRGDVLAEPGFLRPTQRLDVQLKLLPSAPKALEQNDSVDFFTGAKEANAWLTLLDRERIEPGERAWVQLRFREPVVAARGDRCIIRQPSPGVTIGGGVIVDTHPPRHRRFRPEVLSALEALAQGSPDELVLHELAKQPVEIQVLKQRLAAGLSEQHIDEALAQLIAEGEVRVLGEGDTRPAAFVVTTSAWQEMLARMRSVLASYHTVQPLRRGMPREELRSRLRLTTGRLFDDVVMAAVRDGVVVDDGATVRLPEFTIVLDPARRALADRYLAALDATPYAPPSPAEFGIDTDTLGALIDLGEVIRVADGVVYSAAALARLEREVLEILDREGRITLAGFRDHFNTSRKYAQATLEYFDQRRITRRVGDERVRYVGAGAGAPARGEARS